MNPPDASIYSISSLAPASAAGSNEDRYLRALIAHEQGHAAHGIDAAREIERQLSNLKEYPSCDQLQAEAQALARQIIDRYALKDDHYDTDIRDGQDKSLRFP